MVRKIENSDNFVILKKPFDNMEVLQLAHALAEKWELGWRLRLQLTKLELALTERTAALELANQQLKQEATERTQLEKALSAANERFLKSF
jgi:C4-dicarboxylate-specific signal transduction histidine kinase